ncbi:hypothetical protein [Streptomyces prunicolor]
MDTLVVQHTHRLHTHRLRTDPAIRIGERLGLDRQAKSSTTGVPSTQGKVGAGLLEQARERDELLPHTVRTETAGVLVGAFAGVHAISRLLCGYQDLPHQVTGLLRHALPPVTLPRRQPRWPSPRPRAPASRNS